MDKELVEFSRRLEAEVSVHADGEQQGAEPGGGDFAENVFTRLMIADLTELGDLDDGEVCFYEKKVGRSLAKINGFNLDDEGLRLDLFITEYIQSDAPTGIGRDECNGLVKQATQFLNAALAGHHEKMESALDAHAMARRIHDCRDTIQQVRIFLFTNGVQKGKFDLAPVEDKRFNVNVHLWDLERLMRCRSSGLPREAIEVHFPTIAGQAIPCLPMPFEEEGYRSMVAIIPGEVLYELYERHGERLLELNVRSFLQARGKVNRGIRDTILREPGRFFAYNNGITATAEDIRLVRSPDGTIAIEWIKGLQIVNGGQTTASIHRARKQDRADLEGLFVQAKISVVDPDHLVEMVGRISQYANSQNKVNEADFSANDAYHQRIEELSRTIWAPGEQSQWFYERARGQFQVARSKQGNTPARLRQFDTRHPASQVFDKTDLAVFTNSWLSLPHIVSRGGQKNFREFTLEHKKREESTGLDEQYFKRLVAKGILFRQTRRIVKAAGVPSFQANVVTYTVALLAHRSARRLDLDRIWREEGIPDSLGEVIAKLAPRVFEVIRDSAGDRNPTEWCKKEACWEQVQRLAVDIPDDALVPLPGSPGGGSQMLSLTIPRTESPLVERCLKVPTEVWDRVVEWGRQSGKLASWQQGIAETLSRYAATGYKRIPSEKQAKQAMKMLELASADIYVD